MDHSQSTSALDNQVSCTSSAQMVENHVDSIAGTRQSFGPFFKNIFKITYFYGYKISMFESGEQTC